MKKMTKEDAIKFLKSECPRNPYKMYGFKKKQALEMAIKALEESEEPKVVGEDEIYVSENGFTGKMYGERSFSIYNSDGKEVFHTGFRAFNDRKGLIEAVDDFPELIKLLRGEE